MIKKYTTSYAAWIIALTMAAFLFSGTVLAADINVKSVVKLTNESRDDEGLLPLSENERLSEVAESKLSDMIEKEYFAHTSPEGINPWYWFQKEGYDYKYAGENLAINFTSSEDQHKAWMDSPTHKKNILNSKYQEIGVAVGAGEIGGEMSIITVTEFGTRIGAAEVPLPGDNFSGKGSTDLLKSGEKIGPSVLSVKDVSSEGAGQGDSGGGEAAMWKDARAIFSRHKDGLTHYSFIASLVVLMMTAFLAPTAVILMSFRHLMATNHMRQIIAVKFKDNINEIKLVRVNLL